MAKERHKIPSGLPYRRGQAAGFWKPLVAQWRASGLAQVEFCKRRRLSLASLRWWSHRLKKLAGGQPSRASLFAPVRVVSSIPAWSAPLEVELAGGRVLRVRRDFDPQLLRKLVAALEDWPC